MLTIKCLRTAVLETIREHYFAPVSHIQFRTMRTAYNVPTIGTTVDQDVELGVHKYVIQVVEMENAAKRIN
jgi:hypothetical protein